MKRSTPFAAQAVSLLVALPLLAQPVVSDVSPASLTRRQAGVIITGNGLGTKDRAAPLMWDDFEGGEVDELIYTHASNPGWGWVGGTNIPPTYTNTNQRTGSNLSSYHDYSCVAPHLTFGLGPRAEFYVSYWCRHHITVLGEPGNFKEFKMEGNGGDWKTGVPPWDPFPYAYYPDISPQTNVPPPTSLYNRIQAAPYGTIENSSVNDWKLNWTLVNDQWRRREMWVRVTDELGQALKSWDNTTLKRDWALPVDWPGEIGPNMGDYNTRFVRAYFPYYIRSGSNGYGQWDDIYIDTTQARVEIGDASTWEQCSHREIQIASAWSSTSITITVNQGSFHCGSKAYLYVVDADGKMNAEGFPITFGSSEVSLPGPPGTPLYVKD